MTFCRCGNFKLFLISVRSVSILGTWKPEKSHSDHTGLGKQCWLLGSKEGVSIDKRRLSYESPTLLMDISGLYSGLSSTRTLYTQTQRRVSAIRVWETPAVIANNPVCPHVWWFPTRKKLVSIYRAHFACGFTDSLNVTLLCRVNQEHTTVHSMHVHPFTLYDCNVGRFPPRLSTWVLSRSPPYAELVSCHYATVNTFFSLKLIIAMPNGFIIK